MFTTRILILKNWRFNAQIYLQFNVKEDFMKKSLAVVLIVLLMMLLVVGVAFAERVVCGTCNGTGIVCNYCGASMHSKGNHSGCTGHGRGMTCYICDGKRYVEKDACD
jgi:hypothetical protein